MTGRPILSSHLALRFYKHEGWTREILEPFLKRGKLTDQIDGQDIRDYFLLEVGGSLDMDALNEIHRPRVFNWQDQELFGAEALLYLKKMNW